MHARFVLILEPRVGFLDKMVNCMLDYASSIRVYLLQFSYCLTLLSYIDPNLNSRYQILVKFDSLER